MIYYLWISILFWVFFNYLSVCLFVCLFCFCIIIYCSCVIICSNSCALIFNSLMEGLKLVHTGVQQILHVVHFMFYVFLVCVAVFRNASSMFNTESYVFVVLHSISLTSFVISKEFGNFGRTYFCQSMFQKLLITSVQNIC